MNRERKKHSYIDMEKRTISMMLSIYCRGKNHISSQQNLCESCKTLEEYAHKRLENCPFGERKPDCKSCMIHCYKPQMREQIRIVMRYAGIRMLWHAPIKAIKHFLK